MKYLLIFGILFNLVGCNVIAPTTNGVSKNNPAIITGGNSEIQIKESKENDEEIEKEAIKAIK